MTDSNLVLVTTQLEIGRTKKVLKFAILPVISQLEISALVFITCDLIY